jgi:hypothetical protein
MRLRHLSIASVFLAGISPDDGGGGELGATVARTAWLRLKRFGVPKAALFGEMDFIAAVRRDRELRDGFMSRQRMSNRFTGLIGVKRPNDGNHAGFTTVSFVVITLGG